MYQGNQAALSGGLGVICPTADGVGVSFANGGQLVQIDNQSYHLQPFLGGYYRPSDRLFMQGFAQADVDANGNSVALNSTGLGLQNAGRLYDSSFLFLDWSLGYWLLKGANAPVLPVSSFHENGQITQQYHPLSLAPTMELHYARSLGKTDSITAGPLQVGNFTDTVETLTMVLGTNLVIGQNTNLGLGYATSLAGGNNEPFQGAFRLTFNRYFGRN